jgi:hypothetical protein
MRLAALTVIPGEPPMLTARAGLLVDSRTGEIVGRNEWEDAEDAEDGSDVGAGGADNPFDDKPNGQPLPPSEAAAGKPQPISPTTGVKLYELASRIYGDRWNKEMERKVAEGVSKGAAATIGDLTFNEGENLLDIFEKRLATQQAAQSKEEA